MKYKLSLPITNNSKYDLLVILEPWPEYYTLKPKESLTIIGEGGEEGENFEVHYCGKYITIYGWGGSTSAAYQNGEPMEPEYQPIPE